MSSSESYTLAGPSKTRPSLPVILATQPSGARLPYRIWQHQQIHQQAPWISYSFPKCRGGYCKSRLAEPGNTSVDVATEGQLSICWCYDCHQIENGRQAAHRITCRWPDSLMGLSMGMMTCWPSFRSGTLSRFSASVLPARHQQFVYASKFCYQQGSASLLSFSRSPIEQIRQNILNQGLMNGCCSLEGMFLPKDPLVPHDTCCRGGVTCLSLSGSCRPPGCASEGTSALQVCPRPAISVTRQQSCLQHILNTEL